MNRRELIRRGPMALLGVVGAVVGIKAEPPAKQKPIILSVSVPVDESAIIRAVTDDYNRGGKIREAIQHDREWGL